MIDFENAGLIKLRPVENEAFADLVCPILIPGEKLFYSFKGIRDGVVFTDKRVISINIQGVTGKKKDLTTLPYSKIQSFSVETAGVLDLDSELDIWFSGMGKIRFEFAGRADVSEICRMISHYAL